MKRVNLSRIVSIGLLSAMAYTLVGCSHAWVIRRDNQGGVIGYRGYDDVSEANQAISGLVHCPYGYVGTADEMKTAPYSYTTYENVTTRGYRSGYSYRGKHYGYHDTYSTQVPVTRTGTSHWREFTYRCKGVTESNITQNVTIQPMAE